MAVSKTKTKTETSTKKNPWKSTTVRSRVITVTAAIAKQMLKHEHPFNRSTPRHANKLTEKMVNGDWRYNGDTIRFDTSGKMIDGGNRLRAIIESKKSQKVLLALGIPAESRFFINTDDYSRTSAHALQSTGMEQKVAVIAGPTTTKIIGYSGITSGKFRPARMSNYEVVKENEEDAKIAVAAKFVMEIHHQRESPITASNAAFLFYIMSKKSKADATTFIHKLLTGENLASGDPIIKLRAKLERHKRGLIKWTPSDILEVVIKCWNLSRDPDRRVTDKSLSPELGKKFPRVR